MQLSKIRRFLGKEVVVSTADGPETGVLNDASLSSLWLTTVGGENFVDMAKVKNVCLASEFIPDPPKSAEPSLPQLPAWATAMKTKSKSLDETARLRRMLKIA